MGLYRVHSGVGIMAFFSYVTVSVRDVARKIFGGGSRGVLHGFQEYFAFKISITGLFGWTLNPEPLPNTPLVSQV